MPGLLERPKMTILMYQTLKRHIMRERERKKQAEQEQDAILEQQRKEREMRKKKEEDNNLTLEQTKEQITQLQKKLEQLKQEKHDYFSQLKKVLHQEDETRKRAQQKDEMNQPTLYQPTAMQPVSAHSVLHPPMGRPQMYRPTQSIITQPVPNLPMKRPRSPSPTPTSSFQQQYADKKPNTAHYAHSSQDFKPVTYPPAGQQGQVSYQPVHSFQQSSAAHTTSKSPAGKYQPASQSAFTTYPSHYAQHQKPITESAYPPAYQLQRMQQPGYLGSPHSSGIPLQQQLQHANEKAGFNEGDKYKMQQSQIRGVSPQIQAQQSGMIAMTMQQDIPPRGSIVTGFSGRSQAPPTSSYQPSSTQAYQGQPPGRPGYSGQGRYY